MQRTPDPGTAIKQYALRHGQLVDRSACLYLAPGPDTGLLGSSGVLLAVAEVIDPDDHSCDMAAQILGDIGDALADVMPSEGVLALRKAFAEANHWVYQENARTGSQKLFLGLSCVVLCGDDLLIGQVPPGHVLVRQDETLYAFPDREVSTAHHRRPVRDLAHPLGAEPEVDPRIFYTRAAPGDLVAGFSSTIAGLIPSVENDLRIARGPVEFLELIIDAGKRWGLADGYIGVMSLGDRRPHDRLSIESVANSQKPSLRALDRDAPRVQTGSTHAGAREWLATVDHRELGHDVYRRPMGGEGDRVQARPDIASQPDPLGLNSGDHGQLSAADLPVEGLDDQMIRFSPDGDSFSRRDKPLRQTSARPRGSVDRSRRSRLPRWTVRGLQLLELLAGLALSLTAAVVGAWQVTRRDKPIHGPMDDGTLGLPRLQRWHESYRPPRMQRLRSRFPRLEINRVVITFVLILILGGGVAFYLSHSAAREASQLRAFEAGLQHVGARGQEALAAGDLATSYAMLIDARAELDEVVEAHPDHADDPRIDEVRAAIDAELERLTGATQLSNVQTVGAVPSGPAGVRARLVTGNGRVYLLSDAVYQVDVAGGSLVLLLKQGDLVDGQPVEMIRSVTWRQDRLIVIDAKRAYAFDPSTGAWGVEPLGVFDAAGFMDIASSATFDYNLYLLAPETGQILKFAAGLYENNPEDWTAGMARNELKEGIDMAIDGRVWVLLQNGQILNFFRSRLEATIQPQVAPPLDRPVAIYSQEGSAHLYVLNASDGRILRLSHDGQVVQQFITGDATKPSVLTGATDFTIDEQSGIAYILANNTLHTLRLPTGPASTEAVPEQP